ncbi:transporter substrate-binding domain-containing protein [Salmonella enterica]|nr:transporter substrate-binding domain-containing protein [Salmonella enterica]
MFRLIVFIIGLISFCPGSVFASGAEHHVRVGVYISQPFVMSEQGNLTGLAIDLWNSFAGEKKLETEYINFPTINGLLTAVSAGDVDVAVTGITITEERAHQMAFSFPWYDSGLRIMVSSESKANVWGGFLSSLTDAGHVKFYLFIVAGILIATLFLTLLDRKMDDSFPKSWPAGLAESFYHVMSIVTTGKTTHKLLFGSMGKIMAAIWMVCGVTIIAYVTSSITSTMTTHSLQNTVKGVNDLAGKLTGVRRGSEAEKFLAHKGMKVKSYMNLKDAITALGSGEIKAIVADAPSLEYYVKTHPLSGVKLVGQIFHPEKFGFALNLQSPYTHILSTWLIGRHETGELKRMQDYYFSQ